MAAVGRSVVGQATDARELLPQNFSFLSPLRAPPTSSRKRFSVKRTHTQFPLSGDVSKVSLRFYTCTRTIKRGNGGAFCTKAGGVRNGRGGIFFHIHMHANVFQNSPMIEKAFFPISIPGHFPPLFPSNSLLGVCAVLRTIGEGWGLVGGCGKRKRNSDRISSPLSPNVNSPFISSFFSPLLPTAYLA